MRGSIGFKSLLPVTGVNPLGEINGSIGGESKDKKRPFIDPENKFRKSTTKFPVSAFFLHVGQCLLTYPRTYICLSKTEQG
jgi:hypothetical protein